MTGALQHSLSVQVDEEHELDPGFGFNKPEEQLWEVEEQVVDFLHRHRRVDEQLADPI